MKSCTVLLLASLALYAASLPLNSFCQGQNCGWPGWSLLAFGMLTFMYSPANMAWLANPLLYFAWLFTVAAIAGCRWR